MKNYISLLTLLIIICVSPVQAQQNKPVPSAIKSAFEKKYPDKKAEWNWEKNGYAAKFTEHGTGAVVHYNSQGKQTQRDWYIVHSELPEAAVIYLNKYYAGITFPDILKIEDAGGNIIYKVRRNGTELVFNKEGIFIKKQKQTD